MENSSWIRGKTIGKGNFGSVSIGFNRLDGRVFAVKSVAKNSSSNPQLEAIENEIRILRSLSSPFVVNYYSDDTTSTPEYTFRNLHMEYLPGGTLSESSIADEELIRRYTWCLTSALTYVHSQGIIHCDVKGRNVLLGPTPGSAKLADFGSAKKEDDDRTAGCSPRGSPLWMAPEVVRGEFQGKESDVWALGCTLIEMVTGSPAWRDEGAKTLRLIGYSDELPQYPTRLSDLGRDFLDKCLMRDPKKRWSCDMLLQHPLLQFESTVEIEGLWSPKSVIEWPRSKGSVDEEETGDVEGCGSSAEERVGKLAGLGGVNWENEGWVTVRVGGNEDAGTSSKYSESLGVEMEFRSFERVNLSDENNPIVFGDLMCIVLWILYYTTYLSHHNDTSNTQSVTFYTLLLPHTSVFFIFF